MKLLRILTGLIIILLLIFYWTDLLISKEIFEYIIILGYLFIPLQIIENWFQKPVSKNGEKVRIKRYNWNYLIAWTSLGVFVILFSTVINGSEKVIFGYFNAIIAQGIFFVLIGIAFFISIIRIDKNGINTATSFMKNISLKDLNSFSLSNTTIIFNTDSDQYKYKIFKISNKDKDLIIKAITKIKENYVA